MLITAAKVYTMTGPPLAPGAVLVSNGKIVQVASKLTPPSGAKVIDLGGGVLMPGLVDAYSSAGVAGHPAETTREITPDYRVLSYTNDFGAALAAADLVLARSGGSVWELAAAGKPAILVPYPFATADHQTKNARYFQAAGGAILVPETELGRVPELVRSLLDDPRRLEQMEAAMLRAARPDAADQIAEELIALARG